MIFFIAKASKTYNFYTYFYKISHYSKIRIRIHSNYSYILFNFNINSAKKFAWNKNVVGKIQFFI